MEFVPKIGAKVSEISAVQIIKLYFHLSPEFGKTSWEDGRVVYGAGLKRKLALTDGVFS
jgi:hypothetical protein